MEDKIVLIGAGSALFTSGLIADLIRLHRAADVTLVDIDPNALDVAYRLASKIVAATGASITLRATTDRREGLPGATAVICTVGVGGRRAWEQDVFVPRKYGIYAPVGDTVGPGGSSRALRVIPVMVDVARDVIERLMHIFGAFPAVLDRHVTEFFPQFFRDGSYWGCKLGVDTFHFEGTIAEGDSTFAEMRTMAYDPQPMDPATIEREEGEHEQVMDIIDSIRCDRSLIFSANLPNTGQVSNLPQAAIVESPCVANAEGLRPVTIGALPSAIAGTLATRYQWVETIVEAALERSRDKFIQALILDGATSSIEQTVALADELLAVQAAHLPGWKIGVRHGQAV